MPGQRGMTGEAGNPGIPGSTGMKGNKGLGGIVGPQGVKGDKGRLIKPPEALVRPLEGPPGDQGKI